MGDRGLTLVELMVTLAVILLVTAAASTAYVKLLRGVKVQGRLTESQMDTMSGFELLRYDIQMAGYGLFRVFPAAETKCTSPSLPGFYEEAKASDPPDAEAFNEAPGEVPRAFAFSNNTGNTLPAYPPDDNASDVLVIKSLVANDQAIDRKWSFLDSNGTIKSWVSDDLNLTGSDTVIAIDETGKLRICSNWQNANDNSSLPVPERDGDTFVVYGVHSSTMRMPFNRVDYYLEQLGVDDNEKSSFPSRCFPGSFVLYRACIKHSGGGRNPQPLIDCVRDFQVAFGLDTDADRTVNAWVADLNLNAGEIRNQVREVRVFVLYHEGQRDDNFWFSGTLNLGDAQIANDAGFQTLSSAPLTGALSTYTPTGDAVHYRWKVDKLSIKPMNLD